MITHWTLVLVVGLVLGPYRALARPTEPEAGARAEEIYSELAEEFRQLHNQELRMLQYLSVQAERQQHEEAFLQRQREQQQQQRQQLLHEARNSLLEEGSLLDDIPAEFSGGVTVNSAGGGGGDGSVVSGRNLNSYGTDLAVQTEPAQRETIHPKRQNEKKNNHYMSLCHFKLCNMGRKRNQRFPQFWN
ncbi:uncharacterized protein LOC131206705 [Anopheles bellator]|uniref:uncharacterized protein LOC131206705 n=1 Tax=Anopheles bellator TaxID=139047 RepID=UPI002649A5DB|nr:uncharacterized protein LOC131206705 [Anopheles bellator]